MSCFSCGKEMVTEVVAHRYKESGLDYVVLLGVEERSCANCGENELVLPRIAELHRVIARGVAEKEGRLEGQEVRFLRKFLGLSGVNFAKSIGVSAETVSRWENDKQEIGISHERFLRMMVFNERPSAHYPLDKLEERTLERREGKAALRIQDRQGAWTAEGWEPLGMVV